MLQPHQLLFAGLWIAACAYAIWRGGLPERIVAAALLAAAPLTRLVDAHLRQSYGAIEIGVVAVDAGLLALLLGIALWSTRFWPLLMTSMQGSEVLGHLAKLIAPDTVPRAYYVVVAMWSLPMLGLLAWGTRGHRRRLKRYGRDPDWAHQLPPSYRDGARIDE